MDNLFPLVDLRDPIGTIRGGRFPITFVPSEGEVLKDDVRIEWSADRMFCAGDDGCAQALPHEIDPSLPGFALDLSNEDTAQWVDRKIAEVPHGQPMLDVHFALVVYEDRERRTRHFALAGLDIQGRSYLSYLSAIPILNNKVKAELASITPIEANIPTARAALLRALFGREK